MKQHIATLNPWCPKMDTGNKRIDRSKRRNVEVALVSTDIEYPPVQRFWLLDNLRGLASLSVVVFHYQHFYFSAPGVLEAGFNQSAQPFYGFLAIFYNMGYNAVQLFFVISGFVFFFVYYKSLRDRTVSGFEYFVARFSRLYPLHAATLLIVALGQWISVGVTGQFTVYPYNDFYHFVLNVFFASDWGLQLGESFNGPVWSLSVEVVTYFFFYLYSSQIASRSSRHFGNALITIFLLLIIWRLAPTSIREIIRATICFFLGGLAFFACGEVAKLKNLQRLYILAAVCAGGVIALLAFIVTGAAAVLHFVVFPALVLFLGIAQGRFLGAGKKLHLVGDISYSTYLLHFPFQLYIIIITTTLGVGIDFDQPIVFLLFVVLLLVLSIITFYWFERPAQKILRKRMLG